MLFVICYLCYVICVMLFVLCYLCYVICDTGLDSTIVILNSNNVSYKIAKNEI